ncbi:MAG: type II toxin-antitoxin system RelE/ParE family toxin [Paraperlucidibaca sp.]
MMLSLIVTPEAESELIEIWLYTSEACGVEQADQYLDQLEVGMGHLTTHPSLGVDYSHILPGYRKIRIEHHDIFYRVLELEILVVRVLHEDIDAPRRLSE